MPDPHSRPLSRRLRRGVALAAVLGAVAMVAAPAFDNETVTARHGGLAESGVRSAAPTTAAPTSTTTTTTTAPLAPLDDTYQVATAAEGLAHVDVFAEVPPGAVLDERVSAQWATWEAERLPPRTATAPGLSPLPGVGRNLAGRIGVEGGWAFINPNSFGTPPVFWVLEDHGDWLRVQVPARPNGTTGWVQRTQVRLERRSVRVEVSIGAAQLRVLDGDSVLLETPVVVGADRTPTPTGRLYVTHHETTGNPGGGYGPLILGLSGYSETLETFDGGAPSLALHGTNRPELAGQHRSNGCVRVPNGALVALAQLAPPGTVVDLIP